MKKEIVRKSEFLVLAKNSWSDLEAKIFSILVAQLEPQIAKFQKYRTDLVNMKKDLELFNTNKELYKQQLEEIEKFENKINNMIQFKTLTITITELEQYLNTKINTTRVRDLCYTLKSKTYEVLKQNKKDYDYISLFSKITYKTDDKEIIFKFDDEIKIHILDFASQFVTYNIANIVRFKSKYTISFYERFKLQTQFKKEPMITETITLAELKNILNLQNKYKRTNDFKHKVLEVVKNDMQRYSDVYMNYEYIKKGKTIHSIKFFFTKNNTETQQTFFTDDELETAYDKYINKQYKNKDSDLCTIKQIKSALTDVDYIEVIVFNEFAQANQEVKLSKETLKNLK